MAKKYAMIKKTPPESTTAVRKSTKVTYTPEDVRSGSKKYGAESSTKPTPEFIKKAQSEGKPIVKKDGLNYRAGRKEYEHEYSLTTETPKPTLKGFKVTQTKPKATPIRKTAPAQQFGKEPVRKMERVQYLRKQSPGKLTSFEGKKRPKKKSGY
jgi:hypothetical protein